MKKTPNKSVQPTPGSVYSGWTEAVALLAREQSLVVEGLKRIQRQMPVPGPGY